MKKNTRQIFRYWMSVISAVMIVSLAEGTYNFILAADNPPPATDKSTLVADEKTYESLKLFSDVLQEIEENYVDAVETKVLINNAIKGMVGNLDPHSSFMPPEAFSELQDDTRGEFGGVGLVVALQKGLL
ncbi:MAG: hypothetical protein HQK67_02815, partial [Desulfamplus sp.]|nr:hypothetical protein [Desulfamplus sp.]